MTDAYQQNCGVINEILYKSGLSYTQYIIRYSLKNKYKKIIKEMITDPRFITQCKEKHFIIKRLSRNYKNIDILLDISKMSNYMYRCVYKAIMYDSLIEKYPYLYNNILWNNFSLRKCDDLIVRIKNLNYDNFIFICDKITNSDILKRILSITIRNAGFYIKLYRTLNDSKVVENFDKITYMINNYNIDSKFYNKIIKITIIKYNIQNDFKKNGYLWTHVLKFLLQFHQVRNVIPCEKLLTYESIIESYIKK